MNTWYSITHWPGARRVQRSVRVMCPLYWGTGCDASTDIPACQGCAGTGEVERVINEIVRDDPQLLVRDES